MEYARLVGVLEYAIPVLLLRYIEIIPRDREKLEIPRIVCVNAGERLGIRVEPSRAPGFQKTLMTTGFAPSHSGPSMVPS
jgi:hypothetical protein